MFAKVWAIVMSMLTIGILTSLGAPWWIMLGCAAIVGVVVYEKSA